MLMDISSHCSNDTCLLYIGPIPDGERHLNPALSATTSISSLANQAAHCTGPGPSSNISATSPNRSIQCSHFANTNGLTHPLDRAAAVANLPPACRMNSAAARTRHSALRVGGLPSHVTSPSASSRAQTSSPQPSASPAAVRRPRKE